jgi:hypothetical protein
MGDSCVYFLINGHRKRVPICRDESIIIGLWLSDLIPKPCQGFTVNNRTCNARQEANKLFHPVRVACYYTIGQPVPGG